MNETTETQTIGRATYSPEDNKLRLYPDARLPKDLYDRVKAHGFSWAPRQELFVAPKWTPGREDLLIELCGEIGDEDTSLVDRAEQRAERFEGYSERRAADAESAKEAVAAIADNIPFGQPILVGHHSQRRAEKDAEKIESGMRRTVKMWEQSKYWAERAAGAIHAAKYKELPSVRARRIKTLEAEKRSYDRSIGHAEAAIIAWNETPITWDKAREIAGARYGFYKKYPLAEFPRPAGASTYEGDMSLYSALGESPEQSIIQPEAAREIALRIWGKAAERDRRWVNHLQNRIAYEKAMMQESGGIATDKVGPEKGGAVKCWVNRREWTIIQKVNKVSVTLLDNWGNGGRNFTRTVPFDKLSAVMSKAQVDAARAAGRICNEDSLGFSLLDELPKALEPKPEPVHLEKTPDHIEAMRQTLKQGVQVVSANQLFPTPPEIARQVVELAGVQDGQRILEPSAGTGRFLDALREAGVFHARIVGIEINRGLADNLRRKYPHVDTHCADFLELNCLGEFDRIIMNPPFEKGADIKHIEHARTMLKPGGRLVAICANGPRQQEKLKPIASEWIDLPAGSFEQSGTGVNTAIVVIEKE